MLAWGDTTFLPCFYTLQTQYLARYPTHLTTLQSCLVLSTGLAGYTIFRLANAEKDYVRSFNGDAILWGRPAQYIRCTYRTSDGKQHESLLLASGWWGLCRHSNYTGDLIMSFAMCAATGTRHVLPCSYFVYMFVLLNHRVCSCLRSFAMSLCWMRRADGIVDRQGRGEVSCEVWREVGGVLPESALSTGTWGVLKEVLTEDSACEDAPWRSVGI